LVKGLLNFAREGLAQEVRVDLNVLVLEVVALLKRTTLQKIRLVTDLAEDIPTLIGDPASLSHAIMNLCVNAVDAMPNGGLLKIHTCNEIGGKVLLEVSDSGSGMPKEVLARAFDPFFTTKGIGKGTGLGLAIVYNTIQVHHGQMEILSEPSQGTQVRILFPPGDPGPEVSHGIKPPIEGTRTVLKVLLVDDDDLIQRSTQLLLSVLGHNASIASCGEEALALLESGLKPDVVILDMNMPGLGGRGTLPRLRALCPTMPVLLATGNADEEAVNLTIAFPHVSLLAKPYSVEELQRRLNSIKEN